MVIDQILDKIKEQAVEIARLKWYVSHYRKAADECAKENDTLRAEVQRLKVEVSTVGIQKDELVTIGNLLNRENDTFRARVGVLEGKLEDCLAMSQNMEGLYNDVSEERDSLKARVEELEVALGGGGPKWVSDVGHAKVVKERDELLIKNDNQKAAIQSYEVANDELRTQLSGAEDKYETSIWAQAAIEEELEDLRGSVEQYKLQRDTVLGELTQQTKKLNELESQFNYANSIVELKEAYNEELRTRLAEAQQNGNEWWLQVVDLRLRIIGYEKAQPPAPTIVKSMWQRVTSGPCFGDAKDMEIARLRAELEARTYHDDRDSIIAELEAELESLRPKPVVVNQIVQVSFDGCNARFYRDADKLSEDTVRLGLSFHDGKLVSAEVLK